MDICGHSFGVPPSEGAASTRENSPFLGVLEGCLESRGRFLLGCRLLRKQSAASSQDNTTWVRRFSYICDGVSLCVPPSEGRNTPC